MAEEDMLFGKNRHLYGGIEPSDMLRFDFTKSGTTITINAVPPGDTVIDGQVICTTEGALIIKNNKRPPVDEFDGEVFADIWDASTLTDTVSDTESAYYAAYPYSAQGVYNRNPKMLIKINEPKPMLRFETNSSYNSATNIAKVEIECELDPASVGAKIRKSTSGFPIDENDGTLVDDVSISSTIVDLDVDVGTTYYYKAFPYNASNAFNYDSINESKVTVNRYSYLYGFDIKNSDPNPNTRVSYPKEVQNHSFTPAKMNFNSGVFEYGSWPSKAGEKFMPRPCMLRYDGTVAYYLDPNDYSKKIDGSPSDVSNLNFGGNAMMEWPKIYTKRWETSDGVYHFRCCDTKLDPDYDCWCNYDANNSEIDNFYTSIYECHVHENKARSISGLEATVNLTPLNEIAYSKNNSNDCYLYLLSDHMLLQDLLIMISKSTNVQTSFGTGRTTLPTASFINTGTMNSISKNSLFWGSSNGTSGVKIFGMENPWGNTFKRILGLINDASDNVKVKITIGNHDGSTSDFSTTGNGYINIGHFPQSYGYISRMKTEKYGRIAIGFAGGSNQYECDQCWGRLGVVGILMGLTSGASNNDASSGIFLIHWDAKARMDYSIRLSFKPLKK